MQRCFQMGMGAFSRAARKTGSRVGLLASIPSVAAPIVTIPMIAVPMIAVPMIAVPMIAAPIAIASETTSPVKNDVGIRWMSDVLASHVLASSEPVDRAINALNPFEIPIARSGKLRVSNRSEHPIRLALRLRAEKAQGDKYHDKFAVQPRYDSPAHWDFYAGEGSQRGLIVALPNRSVYLKKGDVVVAFAQDGSQRYWGPFVVGETDNPIWNDRTSEWQLILDQ